MTSIKYIREKFSRISETEYLEIFSRILGKVNLKKNLVINFAKKFCKVNSKNHEVLKHRSKNSQDFTIPILENLSFGTHSTG